MMELAIPSSILSQPAQIASLHYPSTPLSFFESITAKLTNSRDDSSTSTIDYNYMIQPYGKVYSVNSQNTSSPNINIDDIPPAVTLQALKTMTSDLKTETSREAFIGLTMAEAARVFDAYGVKLGDGKDDRQAKEQVVEAAARLAAGFYERGLGQGGEVGVGGIIGAGSGKFA